jgi:hypothetical protein
MMPFSQEVRVGYVESIMAEVKWTPEDSEVSDLFEKLTTAKSPILLTS